MKQEIVIPMGIRGLSAVGLGYESMKSPNLRAGSNYSVSAATSNTPASLIATDATVTSDSATDPPIADVVATIVPATPSPDPYDKSYCGKTEDLPDPAKAVLQFEAADSEIQTQGTSILDRVVSIRDYDDYAGSGRFPGSMKVGPPSDLGWVRVSWEATAASAKSRPTRIIFVTSEDSMD